MASIKGLKKDINNVMGNIIDAVYIVEATNGNKISEEGEKIIDDAIATFDDLIAKVNQNGVENKKKHFTSVRDELEKKATQLVGKVNALGEEA